jgi:hypothetical protein
MTFTPGHGPEAVLGEVAAGEVVAVLAGCVAAGVEQAAREIRRPAAAREIAAAVRVLVNVT